MRSNLYASSFLQVMGNTGADKSSKRPFSEVEVGEESQQEPPAKAPCPAPPRQSVFTRLMHRRPSVTLRYMREQLVSGHVLQPRPAPVPQPRFVSRGCQTVPQVMMRLPRPCSTTLPMPWGVMPRGARKAAPQEESGVRQELAELLGYRNMSTRFAAAFGLLPQFEVNENDDPMQLPWNPRPPPELYEGVEVADEDEEGQRRTVATNTSHVGDCRRPARMRRRRQWREAAKSWRRRPCRV